MENDKSRDIFRNGKRCCGIFSTRVESPTQEAPLVARWVSCSCDFVIAPIAQEAGRRPTNPPAGKQKARTRRAGEGVAIMLAVFGEAVWAVKVIFTAWLDHWGLFLAMIVLTVFIDQFVIPMAFTLK